MKSSSSHAVSSQQPAAEKPLETILNTLQAIIYVADMETYELLFTNKSARDLFNTVDKKLCWQTFYPKLSGPCSFCTNDRLLDNNGNPCSPVQWETESFIDGSIFKFQDQAIIWNNGRRVKLSIGTDISTEKQIKSELNNVLAAKKEWEEVFDTINDAITIHDTDFNIIRANQAAEKILGVKMYDILRNKCFESYHDTICPPGNCPSCQTFISGKPSTNRIYEPSLDKYLEIKALPRRNQKNKMIGLVHIVRDISTQEQEKLKRKNLQKQLIRSQKLEAIGQLAGGVAHDFNNLLTGILGFTGLAMEQIERDSPLLEDLQEVQNLAKRAAGLTRQLLTFSQRQPADPIEINLNDIIENLAKMLRRLLGNDVELILNLTESPIHLIADPGQIEQIIANLSVNSRQALPNGGTLIIQTKTTMLTGSESFFAAPQVIPGEYAVLEVTDTGFGMDNTVQEQIFEPFFTTKNIGQGSGLGMSMVYGIVQEHNGYITVSSEPDAGTTISILLPLAFKSKIDNQSSSPFYNTLNETETILLVDDDDHIRKLLKRVLIKMGYKVYSADNCKLAENIMKKYSTEIDLLLIDVIMPQLSGKEIFDRLLILKPELKVIFMSGYTGDSQLIKEITLSNHPFIEKPISFTKLATTLKNILEK